MPVARTGSNLYFQLYITHYTAITYFEIINLIYETSVLKVVLKCQTVGRKPPREISQC